MEKEEDKQAAGRHPTGLAAMGGNQVPSPVTLTDWKGKRLDEILEGDLDLPVQSLFPNERDRSRSPVLGVGSKAKGGASKNKDEKHEE